MPTRVAVVVVTYNNVDDVDPLLDALPAAADGLDLEVVVVDNGSADGTADRAQAHGGCRVVRQANRGYSAGINVGVAHADRPSVVLVLNPDARPGPGSVRALVDAMGRTGAGIVAPRVTGADGRLSWSLRRWPTLGRASGLGFTGLPVFSEYVTERSAYEHEHAVDWALGAALLVDVRCHEALGGWDESFFLYSEETDLCRRAAAAGWLTWYTPTAEVMHVGGGSGQNDLTHTLQIVNRVRFYARHHGRPAALAYYLLTLLSEATWVARGHRQSRAAIRALLRPRTRPSQLGDTGGLVPR